MLDSQCRYPLSRPSLPPLFYLACLPSFLFCLKQSLRMQPRLSKQLVIAPVANSQVLERQACAATPGDDISSYAHHGLQVLLNSTLSNKEMG